MKFSAISTLAILLSFQWGAAIAEASSIESTGSTKGEKIYEGVEPAKSYGLRGTAFGSLPEANGITERNLQQDTCGGVRPAQWKNYQWPTCQYTLDGDEVVDVTVETVLEDNWMSYFNTSLDDWNQTESINLSASDLGYDSDKAKECASTYGKIRVCNYDYGESVGWLGIASIGVNSWGHITRGVVKINDYYFEMEKHNTTEKRGQVMCQEMGHIFGLGHWDENFSTICESCMDYSNNPYPKPHKDDLDKLDTMYENHCDERRLQKYTYDQRTPHIEPPGHDESHSHSSTHATSEDDDIYWVSEMIWPN